jgi:trimeric autotransporter adhesin
MLDIVDIVNNDGALAAAAGDVSVGNNGAQPNQTFVASGTGGFGELPGYLNGVGGVNDHGGTILQYQDNQAQTNFWSQFIAEANQLNNTLDGIANGTITPTNSEIQSLITQVNNYNEFGASFTGAEGGVFGDRFDNELLSGTLKTDSAAAVAGLQSIEANGLNDSNAAQLVAAGVGFVADANDVSGNNLPTGGGSFVGTSTTVQGATTTGAATPGTTVPAGAVDGNDNPTNNPVNGLTNNGFGTTNPNPNTSVAGNQGSGNGGGHNQGGHGSGGGSQTAGNQGSGNGGHNQGGQNQAGGHSQGDNGSAGSVATNQGSGNNGHNQGGQGFADHGGDSHANVNFHQMMVAFEHIWHHA